MSHCSTTIYHYARYVLLDIAVMFTILYLDNII